jgi:hypothetical protein
VLPTFSDCRVTFASTHRGYAADVEGHAFRVIPDASRDNKIAVAWCVLKIGLLLLRTSPSVIITTGAAPGYLAARMGKIFGARVCWIDSIANVEELSLSGQMIGKHADLWLTQWKHLSSLENVASREGRWPDCKWAASRGRNDVHAQIASGVAPSHVSYDRHLTPQRSQT